MKWVCAERVADLDSKVGAGGSLILFAEGKVWDTAELEPLIPDQAPSRQRIGVALRGAWQVSDGRVLVAWSYRYEGEKDRTLEARFATAEELFSLGCKYNRRILDLLPRGR